ncbi:unnamed protein product [Adineta ricciae]|uniref:NAD(P)(+)--arginine ADP-ribosyltransferase n=1 Tax=Adineta ricciae TaxID=249248 RepID=A0A816DX79_ADIRI|nr:unnamed protein product [Adineta ricciae]
MATDEGENAMAQRILRITDVEKEPLEFLAPLDGYETMPLVSIEEAVESLVPILPYVQSYVYVAKRRCKKPADGLSEDESASIMLYTMGWKPLDKCLYFVLNTTLRAKDREALKPWYLYLKLFLSALFRLPPLQRTVFRGVKSNMTENYIKDETVVWWAFSSCTTSIGVLKSELFLGKTCPRTIFNIECQSARDIRKHSYYSLEDEVLLLPATQFKVVSCLDQDDLHIIQLQETIPPFPLLQPPSMISSPDVSTTTDTPRKAYALFQICKIAQIPIVDFPLNQYFYSKVSILAEQEDISPPQNMATTTSKKLSKLERCLARHRDEYELYLTCMELIDKDMKLVADYIINKKKALITLSLSSNEIGAEGMQYLSNVLRQNTTLALLFLPNNKIGDKGVQYLSDALRQNTTLEELSIESNQITDDGIEHLTNALRSNITLIELGLGGNQIGDKGAQYISDVLRQNTTLTKLILFGNQIGDKGAQCLSDSLQQNTTLEELNLYNNQIGPQGKNALTDLQKNNKALKMSL